MANASRLCITVEPRGASDRILKAAARAPANDREELMSACIANRANGSIQASANIDPHVVDDLGEVEGHYQTPHGEVAVDWVRKDSSFRMTLEVPPNATAEVRVPTGGDAAHVTPDGATLDHIEGDRTVYRVQAGSYVFTARDAHAGS